MWLDFCLYFKYKEYLCPSKTFIQLLEYENISMDGNCRSAGICFLSD